MSVNYDDSTNYKINITREIKGHTSAVNAVRFTRDGNYLLSVSDDRVVKLWNPYKDDPSASGNSNGALLIKTYSGAHGYGILDVAISKDNSRFASCGVDKTCFLWDVTSGQVTRRLQGHSQKINTCDMNDDGTVLMTGSYDKTLSFWDLRSHSRDPIQTLTDFQDSVTSVVSPSTSSSCNGYIVAGSIDGKLRSYDMRKGLIHVDDLKDPITCIRMAANGKVAVSMCLGGSIKINEITTGHPLLHIQGGHLHEKYKSECCISSVQPLSSSKGSTDTNNTTNTKIFSASEDGKIVCYDFITGNVLYNTPQSVHTRAISSIVHHHKDPFFVTSAYDGSIKCWNYTINN